jgi:hypothetical protein
MIEPIVFFVEGKDDKRFFERIISLFFKSRLRKTEVRVIMHAQLSSEKLNRHIKALNESGVEYFFVIDKNSAKCISEAKERTKQRICEVDLSRIIVVVPEIEAWYLAGLDKKACQEIGVPFQDSTDTVTKKVFEEVLALKYKGNRRYFTQRLLDMFSLETAKRKNRSFAYFVSKLSHLCRRLSGKMSKRRQSLR